MKQRAFTLWLGLATVAAACSPAAEPSATAARAVMATADTPLARPARWMLLPDSAALDYFADESGGTRRIIAQGLRVTHHADGSLEQSSDALPAESVRAERLPARFGGGYLFIGEQGGETFIWRASDWTSKAQPVAMISERVDAIVVGFDRLYVELPLAYRWGAIDLDSGKALPLDPLPAAAGYTSMAFVDSWFGAVATDVIGVMVTFDAGASWHRLSGFDAAPRVKRSGSDLVIGDEEQRLRLSSDGTLRRYSTAAGEELFSEVNAKELGELSDREPYQPSVPAPRLDGALRDAVLHGFPTAEQEAVVATQGGLARVRLTDGAILEFAEHQYPGSEACQALPLDDGVGFACQESSAGTSLYRLSAPLEMDLVQRFSDTRRITSSGNGALVLGGSCEPEAPVREPAAEHCVRHRGGRYQEVRVRGDVGVERLVALRDGTVVLLIPPRLGTPGRLTRLEGAQQTDVVLDLSSSSAADSSDKPSSAERERERAFLETGSWLDQLVQLDDNSVGTWVVGSRGYRGARVQLDGTVRSFSPPEGGNVARTLFHQAIAFEATPSGLALVTTNLGADWSHVDAPPGFYPLDERTALALLGPAPRIGCTAVGCAYGAWLRVGYEGRQEPQTALKAETRRADDRPATLTEAATPERVNFNPGSYFEWRPECYAMGRASPAPGELGRLLNRAAATPPRRGLVTGFLPGLLGSAGLEGRADRVFREFVGVPGPEVRSGLGFDNGSDSMPRFHAYAWADSAAQWAGTAAWQLRISDPFHPNTVWATTPTYAPWGDALVAAELFGAVDGARSGADWTLELDPGGEGGVLRIGSSVAAELHVAADGRAIQSYGTVSGGRLAGAVKAGGQWYYGQHEGSEFRVFRLGPTGPERLASHSVQANHRASLIRTSDGHRLGILVRTRAGSWHVYPLSQSYAAELPLSVSREHLNASPRICGRDAEGWLAVAPVPLSRLDLQGDSSSIGFSGELTGWRAKAPLARLLIRDGSVCVVELAAETARKGTRAELPSRSPQLPSQSLSLALFDSFLGRRHEFRCSL